LLIRHSKYDFAHWEVLFRRKTGILYRPIGSYKREFLLMIRNPRITRTKITK